jgi:hypothetical protein
MEGVQGGLISQAYPFKGGRVDSLLMFEGVGIREA